MIRQRTIVAGSRVLRPRMFLLTLTVVVLGAPAPASGQEIPILEAAGGALRDVIADVMRGEYDVQVSRTIYEPAGESAEWSDSAYAAILESLGIMTCDASTHHHPSLQAW